MLLLRYIRPTNLFLLPKPLFLLCRPFLKPFLIIPSRLPPYPAPLKSLILLGPCLSLTHLPFSIFSHLQINPITHKNPKLKTLSSLHLDTKLTKRYLPKNKTASLKIPSKNLINLKPSP